MMCKSGECLESVLDPTTVCNVEVDGPRDEPLQNSQDLLPKKSDIVTQTRNVVHYRSKYCQVSLSFSSTKFDVATSPIKPEGLLKKSCKNLEGEVRSSFQSHCEDSSTDTTETLDTETEWQSNEDSSEDNIPGYYKNEGNKFRSMFIQKIENRLRLYTGVPKEYKNVIETLVIRSSLKKYFIYLSLYKIKSNMSFQQIADLFAISKAYASTVFARTTLVLAEFMRHLIYWPSSDSIKTNLPIQFRMSFYNVQSIIDCLEIQIHKPSDPVQQALTWSEYEKCNTIKYLISCTPDGFINFISCGYGGRASDVAIFEDCGGYLKVLAENCVIMADRGFKQIETSLRKKKCTLVRPPSVLSNVKKTKDDVLLTKRIASVRIHIERIINRLRHFKMLGPHSTLSSAMVQKLDNISIVSISCAIINLQKPIIIQ
ncbi:uncharacterized protein LOC115875514 [Sitophilus oryzae]|uniref:Uncharacterized protein LOC115875514 n=1 Tax=Sitophilus oryzae TaxID=7048 RepID=A0A6J2X6P7_SITOR|nr:uncharacterized protein LOC115875514 [Sitophilus oryzae]